MKKSILLLLCVIGFGAQTASAFSVSEFLNACNNNRTRTAFGVGILASGLAYYFTDEKAKAKGKDGNETSGSTYSALGKRFVQPYVKQAIPTIATLGVLSVLYAIDKKIQTGRFSLCGK